MTILLEKLRKPKLELRIVSPIDVNFEKKPAKKARFLGLELVNNPLIKIFRWMSRNAAIQCHGTITFYHLDGQKVFDRTMPIRWSNSLQPIAMNFEIDGKRYSISDLNQFTLEPKIDVYPGESERIDLAARFDEENESYGWSNQSYFSDPPWRNPDWKLSKGRYLIYITITSSGDKCKGLFRLINDVGQKDFRIENARPEDFKKI